jgi:redox-sensitive bicupin YhaK (pirin superfamily)
MSTQPCSEPECLESEGAIALVIESRPRDLGDFEVRRVLPSARRQRVGPFIFFDQMGPAEFAPGQGIGVRPHPHIGLATVTYLFDGVIRHQDSLGFDQPIEPGAVNWMTAGRGIVHSERTPDAMRASGSRLHGLQVWLALPNEKEEIEPAFVHHPADTIPHVTGPGFDLALVAGAVLGKSSPVEVASPTFYLAGELQAGAEAPVPDEHTERAVYVVEGEVELDGRRLAPGSMAVLHPEVAVSLRATTDARIAIVGGEPIEGDRFLFWNFVSSSRERIEQAKRDWREDRFAHVPGDDEFIPLPED